MQGNVEKAVIRQDVIVAKPMQTLSLLGVE